MDLVDQQEAACGTANDSDTASKQPPYPVAMVRYRSMRRTCSDSKDDPTRAPRRVTGQEVNRIKVRRKDPQCADHFEFAARDENLIPQTCHFAATGSRWPTFRPSSSSSKLTTQRKLSV